MTFSPNGIHTALATPFTEDDTFDEAAFRRLIDFQLAAGASGLLVIGGSGESVSLTPPGRQRRATCAQCRFCSAIRRLWPPRVESGHTR